jgi:hypothetical protein
MRMTYPWEQEPATDDLEFGEALETAPHHHHKSAGPPRWMNTVVPLLQKYRGDIPLWLLVGWVHQESGGNAADKTALDERGYFQLMPEESQTLKLDHARLSEPEYSVMGGIKLVHYYARLVRRMGIDPAAPSFWPLVKLQHSIGMGDARKVVLDAKAHGVDMKSWPAIRAHATANHARLHLHSWWHRALDNVDGTIRNGVVLLTRWETAQVFQPELEAGCNCQHETTDLESEDEADAGAAAGVTSRVPWDQEGVEYVKWLQRSLNQVLKLKPPLVVDGNPTSRTMSALERAQRHTAKGVWRAYVGRSTGKTLVHAGASPPPLFAPPPAVGFDCNWSTLRVLSCIKKATWNQRPVSFVVRYYSSGVRQKTPNSKDLTPKEAIALTKLGIRIATVWELRAKDASGHTNGLHHGWNAFRQASACGQPADTPIYFAVDFPPEAGARESIAKYFEGVRDGFAMVQKDPKHNPKGLRYQIGVYGNRTSLDWCKAQGIATWFWQSCSPLTASLTNQFRWPGANLHQVKCTTKTTHRMLCPGCQKHACQVAEVDWNESGGHEGSWLSTLVTTTTAPSVAQPELEFRERRRERLAGA